MERLEIKLNGWDCSRLFNRHGAVFVPIRVEGVNAGVSTSRTVIPDLVRVKDSWTLAGNAVRAEEFSRLLALGSLEKITAIYPSPLSGAVVTKEMIPTLSEATRVPRSAGELWYSGWTLTLEEV